MNNCPPKASASVGPGGDRRCPVATETAARRTQPAASRDISNGSPTAVNRPSEGEATPTAALGEGGDASGSEPKKAKAPRKIRTYEKYDENMLASSKGLHRLLGMAKKLKLRKPHKENTRHNLTKILEVYQIWGHTLYPSARFEEFVTMTEKLCHKNRMKIAHKALLEEERRRVRGEYRDGPTPPPEDAFVSLERPNIVDLE
ncbi:replication fork protection component Swi3-domain-containing protein [Zopfochytrium polystomum]|nr:replication fork protection component Swi3-domain-containing protein [Zopfochytrium polystomum]